MRPAVEPCSFASPHHLHRLSGRMTRDGGRLVADFAQAIAGRHGAVGCGPGASSDRFHGGGTSKDSLLERMSSIRSPARADTALPLASLRTTITAGPPATGARDAAVPHPADVRMLTPDTATAT